jgi:protein tyrosine phosphatase (PTP) superfamily phosphohydrolase (DUF442 family)
MGPSRHSDVQRRRHPARILLFVSLGYLGVAALGKAAIAAGVVIARSLGRDPRTRDRSLPAIKHLRIIDERLWVGAQPHMHHYRELARLGVRTVVDVRTGGRTDPRSDDPESLRSLGLDYEWLPVIDGHAPDTRTANSFIDIVEKAEGIVFLHCGGGVGRTTSLTAAYNASQDRNPSLMEPLAIGPMSLEQAWFIAAVGRPGPSPRNPLIRALSRYVVDAPRVMWGKLTR